MKKILVVLAIVLFSTALFAQQIIGPVQSKLSDCAWPTQFLTVINGMSLCPVMVGGVPSLAVAANQGPFSMVSGQPGQAATITVGSVTSAVTASVTNSGTPNAAIFDFAFQKGDKGDKGDTGTLVGSKVLGSGSMLCAPAVGTVQKGFVCTFNNLVLTVSAIQ